MKIDTKLAQPFGMENEMSHDSRDAASEWFLEIVEPTVKEFLEDPSSKRRGCSAVLLASTMVEHFYGARADIRKQYENVEAFRESIWNVYGNDNKGEGKKAFIAIIHDAANAIKHCDRRSVKKEPNIPRMSSRDVTESVLAACGTMRAGWPVSSRKEVIIGVDKEWRLAPLLESTMDFWKKKLEL